MWLSQFRSFAFGATALVGLTMGFAAPSQAVVIYGGTFSGNDCGGKDGVNFPNCHATTTGANKDATSGGSPSIYKFGPQEGGELSGNFPSITGGEFTVTLNTSTNVLTWAYTPGLNDPEVHYFTIKQANGYALFYDTTAPITNFTTDLDNYFPNNPGFSHVTFFDTGSPPRVPEPATLAVFGMGLLGLGFAARRRKA